jgi:ADP-ribose pyrophosphatase
VSGVIRRVQAREVYANDYIVVHDDDVEFADGRAGRYLRIESAGGNEGVVIVATFADRIALVRVFRYPIGRWQWGLPRGFGAAQDPLVAARAELREELGIADPVSLTVLGSFTPDSGIRASSVYVVHADVDRPSEQPEDTEEVAEVTWATADVLDDLIRSGKLDDGMTLAALAIARRHRIAG